MSWLRLHTSLIGSAKVLQLDCSVFKTWVLCLCIAKNSDGLLPDIDTLAFHLRLRKDVAEKHLEVLIERRLIDSQGGENRIHDWSDWQYESDTSTSRVRRFRERSRNVSGNVSCNAGETFQERPQITDTDTDINNPVVLTGDAFHNEAPRPLSAAEKAKALQVEQEEWFSAWWSKYPRKTARKAALASFRKAAKNQSAYREILEGLERQLPMLLAKAEEYRPHGSTWLNQERWRDTDGPAPVLPAGKPTQRNFARDLFQPPEEE